VLDTPAPDDQQRVVDPGVPQAGVALGERRSLVAQSDGRTRRNLHRWAVAIVDEAMTEPQEIELVFEPLEEGGYHVYAPDLPGLHTQGDDLEDASANAKEALALYVEGLRQDGGSLDTA